MYCPDEETDMDRETRVQEEQVLKIQYLQAYIHNITVHNCSYISDRRVRVALQWHPVLQQAGKKNNLVKFYAAHQKYMSKGSLVLQ